MVFSGNTTFTGRAKRAAVLITLCGAVAIAGCSSKPRHSMSTHGAAAYGAYSQTELRKALDLWGRKYEANRKDRDAALGYASALRLNGQLDQAVAVLRQGMIHHGKDRQMASAYGKALAAKGQFSQALRVIRSAQQTDRPDWRLLSAEGAVLDQTGQHNDARRAYQEALKIAPGEPSVLNNLALSYALTSNLKDAERILRQAVNGPKSDSRVRQNLALVLGLQGKFEEAHKVAVAELPPEQAQANIEYLKSMLSQRNTWKDIKRS